MQPRQAFGQRVRELREQRGMKQTTLAAALGYAPSAANSAVSKLERGELNLSLEKILRLAEVLNVPPSELFTAEPPAPQPPPDAVKPQLHALIDRLPDDLAGDVLRLLLRVPPPRAPRPSR